MDWYRVKHSLGLIICQSGMKRAEYLRKHKVLGNVGANCMIMFRKVPLYPKLISIGDNVWIASNVSLITHDVIHRMLNNMQREEMFQEYLGCIDIKDNVFIGANTTILPNVTIGSNTIIGAGSLVNKSLKGNGCYGGVPVRFICSIEEIINKRSKSSLVKIDKDGKEDLSQKTVEECWAALREYDKDGFI